MSSGTHRHPPIHTGGVYIDNPNTGGVYNVYRLMTGILCLSCGDSGIGMSTNQYFRLIFCFEIKNGKLNKFNIPEPYLSGFSNLVLIE